MLYNREEGENMNYRTAKGEDLEEILLMKNEVKKRIEEENLPIWLDGYPFDDMIAEDIQLGYGRIVEEEGKILAYACFHPADFEYPPHTFLKDNVQSFGRVMVRSGYTNRHIGAFLISSMIEEAKTLSVEGLGILVDSFNVKALGLYKKYGFQKEGSKQFPYAYLDIYGLYF